MFRVSRHICIFALLALVVAPTATAGEIDYPFAVRLQDSDPNRLQAAIVVLEDQVDTRAVGLWLDAMHATRAFRHEVVVNRLRDKARTTQGGLIAVLEQQVRLGRARQVESFWLMNAIFVQATPGVLAAVAQRADVAKVFDGAVPIELIRPVAVGEAGERFVDANEPGVADINAPALWSKGIDGTGVLVSNIDTGVHYDHVALKGNWRGDDAGVTLAEAWHDPVTPTTTKPRDLRGHGTHTMGTICGAGGIGVAPGAKWIASASIDRVSITRTVTDAFKSFQWIADPDGNPATVHDTPVVCSNSWGLSPLTTSHGVSRCDPQFWQAIDNAEHAGVTVVFAAGNEGTRGGSAGSLRTPSDRIASPVSVLAVGALSTLNTAIASFSSRGPSGCDGKTPKPDLCARGQTVRSCYIGGTTTYRSLNGTSMACPHVAGAIALLAQAWPEATPTELKTSLLTTCVDLGAAGDDSVFGEGRIDCLAAYTRLMSIRPNVSVSVMGSQAQVDEGETFYAHLVVSNNTATPQQVRITVQFHFQGAPTSLVILPPTDVTLGAGVNNRTLPIPVALPVPMGLPAAVRQPAQWSLRATVERFGGGAVTHVSDLTFVIGP